jgi:arginyl-tRNA synthetase
MPPSLPFDAALAAWLHQRLQDLYPDAGILPSQAPVVRATDARFGDYQSNAAMQLKETLRLAPRAIAEAVAGGPLPSQVAKIDVAGPGFLNFHLAPSAIATATAALAADERLGVPAAGAGRTVVLDYSSPNVAKPMHIGHIRSTVIGNALDRLHRFLGYRVLADNHIGDWGTQFGKLILGYRNYLDEAALAEDPIAELERVYVLSQNRSEAEPEWLEACRRELVKLQQGDPENLALWRRFIDLSLGEFERLYRRLGVRFDLVRGESFYNDRLAGVVDDLLARGLATVSEEAVVVNLEHENLGVCIVRKKDGGFNYATSDLATVDSRVQEFQPDAIVYVTDERQQLHFKQFFRVSALRGVTNRLVHVWFGLMRLPEGTISTRKGNVIKLEHLLDEAEARAARIVAELNPDMPESRRAEIARAVGLGAVKYADLSQNPQSLVTFSWDKALSMEGNSAPYLQYACARISSVLDKAREAVPGLDLAAHPIRLDDPVERQLALKLCQFPEAVLSAAGHYRPNYLCDYLFELAQVYSRFYQNLPFLKAEPGVRESRLRLGQTTGRVLRQGLALLGIETPERI